MKTNVANQMQRPNLVSARIEEEAPVSILFIEDDPHVAAMYRLELETDGYYVTIARSEGGISHPLPDLIFLDIRVPHRDRIGILRSLRSDRATSAIPIVIVSDYREDELRDAGARLGDGEYFIRSEGAAGLSRVEEWTAGLAELD